MMGERYAYGCGAQLDGFKRVLNLKEAAFGGEGAKAAELVRYPSWKWRRLCTLCHDLEEG